jgi:hypothetical protein
MRKKIVQSGTSVTNVPALAVSTSLRTSHIAGGADSGESTSEIVADSAGHLPGSPDYVDEALVAELDLLPQELREQKRLQANQYKLEGNALYKDGKTQGR